MSRSIAACTALVVVLLLTLSGCALSPIRRALCTQAVVASVAAAKTMDTKTGVFDTKLHAALKGGGQAADFEDVSTAAAAAARAETELAGDYSAAAAVASKQDYADAARAAQSELSRRVALLKKLAKSSRAFSSGTGSSDTLTTDATNALRAAIGVIASIRVVNDALQAHKNAVCK